MKPVSVNISFKATDLPDGVEAGVLVVTLEKEDASPAVDVNGTAIAPISAAEGPYVFSGVPSGSYIATAQRLDAIGKALGAPVSSAPYAVVQPTFDAPATVTINVS